MESTLRATCALGKKVEGPSSSSAIHINFLLHFKDQAFGSGLICLISGPLVNCSKAEPDPLAITAKSEGLAMTVQGDYLSPAQSNPVASL